MYWWPARFRRTQRIRADYYTVSSPMSCHNHRHDDDDHLPLPASNVANLYPVIDLANVKALNACNPDTAARIIRPNDKRFQTEPVLVSDADEELIITVPFTGLVKLHGIFLRSYGDASSPSAVKVYKNNLALDFDTIHSADCVQKLEYPEGVGAGMSTEDGSNGIIHFVVNRAKFSNVSSLTLHIPTNYGAEQTALLYIGFRGDFTELKTAPVVAQYEAAANPKDHKVETPSLQPNSSLS